MKTIRNLFVIVGVSAISSTAFAADADSDGYNDTDANPANVDCNDADAAINPAAVEICGDSIDNNCDGLIDDKDTTACPAGAQVSVAVLTPDQLKTACTLCAKPAQVEKWTKFLDLCVEHSGTIDPAACKKCVLPKGDGGIVSWSFMSYTSADELARQREMAAVEKRLDTQEAITTRLEERDSPTRTEFVEMVETVDLLSKKVDLTAEELKTLKGVVTKLGERLTASEKLLADLDVRHEDLVLTVMGIEGRISIRIDKIEVGLVDMQASTTSIDGAIFGAIVAQKKEALERDGEVRQLRPGTAGGLVLAVGITERKYGEYRGAFYGAGIVVDVLAERVDNEQLESGTSAGLALAGQAKAGYVDVQSGLEIGGVVEAGFHGTGMVGADASVSGARIGGGLQAAVDLAGEDSGLYVAPTLQVLAFAEPSGYTEADGEGHNLPQSFFGGALEVRLGIAFGQKPSPNWEMVDDR